MENVWSLEEAYYLYFKIKEGQLKRMYESMQWDWKENVILLNVVTMSSYWANNVNVVEETDEGSV